MIASNSAGEFGEGREPSVFRRVTTSGIFSTSRTSSLTLSTTAFGVPFGAIRPNHDAYLNVGTPASATVGTSGTSGWRLDELTASMRTLPALACSAALGIGAK